MSVARDDMTPEYFLFAYSRGAFPMAETANAQALWYSPDERAVIPLDHRFHVPKRLARSARSGKFEIRFNTNFAAVIEECGQREHTWLNQPIKDVFNMLHKMGHAHSVEAYAADGCLVGGLYGLALGGAFIGESMFSTERDASKIALLALVDHLRARGFMLLDSQTHNPHLDQFGMRVIPKAEYLRRLADAIALDIRF